MDIYKIYENYVKNTLNDISNFKNNKEYTYMLEHVSFEQGKEYMKFIINKFNLSKEEIISFCVKNDSIGNPQKYNYFFITCSPTSLRYVLHSLLILEYIKKLNLDNINIVEVGGGYGGLCLAMYHFAYKFDLKFKYTIIDLKYPSLLQSKYLKLHSIDVNCVEPYGENLKENNYFLISNYAFSEFDSITQEKYRSILFPKLQHGFITWNYNTEPYYFGFDCEIIDEFPQTGRTNKYVYF